jgi:hypothetical protein
LKYNNSVPIPTVSKKPIKPIRNSKQSVNASKSYKTLRLVTLKDGNDQEDYKEMIREVLKEISARKKA